MEGKNVPSVKAENLFKTLIFEGLKEDELKGGERGTQVELLWERDDGWKEGGDREGQLGVSAREGPTDRVKS